MKHTAHFVAMALSNNVSKLALGAALVVVLGCAKVNSPGRTDRSPSAILEVRDNVTGLPASREALILGAPAGSTPTMRTSGRSPLSAADTPETSPPPPMGT